MGRYFANTLNHQLRLFLPPQPERDRWSSKALAECMSRLGESEGYSISDTAVANWLNGTSVPDINDLDIVVSLIAQCLTENPIYLDGERKTHQKSLEVEMKTSYFYDTTVPKIIDMARHL